MAYVGYAQPTNNAATPPARSAGDVIAIYGESYTSLSGIDYNPDWGQSGKAQVNPAYNPGTGNLVLAYPNFNYQGTNIPQQDASSMEFLHVDLWTNASPAATTIQVSPINTTPTTETLVTIPYTSGSWTSIDIPKSAFTGMTWNAIYQLKFAANAAGSTVPVDIYLDNIYFWKAATNASKDASLTDLKVDGSTIGGFGSGIVNYTYDVPTGSSVVPQITGVTTTDAGATTVVTQASVVPGNATVVVTSADASTTKTYTVSYAFNGPSVPAPTPPNRNAGDVISIFSNSYANIAVNTFDTPWCPGITNEVSIAGNATKKVIGLGCEGVDFSNSRIDATSFTGFHMDIYFEKPILDQSFNIKFSQWGGGAGEVSAIGISVTQVANGAIPALETGKWLSIDVPLSSWFAESAPPSLTRNDLAQFVISSTLGTVYYDNLYLYKGIDLNTDSFKAASINMYPNPVKNILNIEARSNIKNVSVYNVLGQKVIEKSPNSNSISLQTSNLQNGVYVVKANIDGKISTSKFVKQ